MDRNFDHQIYKHFSHFFPVFSIQLFSGCYIIIWISTPVCYCGISDNKHNPQQHLKTEQWFVVV